MFILQALGLIVVVIWAYRVEMSMNELNQTTKKILDELKAKKEKK